MPHPDSRPSAVPDHRRHAVGHRHALAGHAYADVGQVRQRCDHGRHVFFEPGRAALASPAAEQLVDDPAQVRDVMDVDCKRDHARDHAAPVQHVDALRKLAAPAPSSISLASALEKRLTNRRADGTLGPGCGGAGRSGALRPPTLQTSSFLTHDDKDGEHVRQAHTASWRDERGRPASASSEKRALKPLAESRHTCPWAGSASIT